MKTIKILFATAIWNTCEMLKIDLGKYAPKLFEIMIDAKGHRTLDFALIDNVEVHSIDHKDHPDYSDAYIASADYKGREATEDELDIMNEDGDFRYEQIMNAVF